MNTISRFPKGGNGELSEKGETILMISALDYLAQIAIKEGHELAAHLISCAAEAVREDEGILSDDESEDNVVTFPGDFFPR